MAKGAIVCAAGRGVTSSTVELRSAHRADPDLGLEIVGLGLQRSGGRQAETLAQQRGQRGAEPGADERGHPRLSRRGCP
jgi:hypothetical protein